jgi:hypothetical protein
MSYQYQATTCIHGELKKMNKYEVGEVVLYQNGDNFELGIIKRLGNSPDTYFVWYHMGDTAACTNERNLHKIINLYAFEIKRLKVDDLEATETAKKEHELLEMYRTLEEWVEEYNTSDSTLRKQGVLAEIRVMRHLIAECEEELK